MQIYFLPLACSMAVRIALIEAGAEARYIEVDEVTKQTRDGQDLRAVNPLGLVPTLRTDDGEVLTENAAVLQYIAARYPEAGLAPTDLLGRTRLQQWLNFVSTELHRGLFAVLFDRAAPEAAKAHALTRTLSRFDHLARHLEGREFLLDGFSVADAYLVTVLGWTVVTPIDLSRWPALAAYVKRLQGRRSVARAIAEERPLYAEQQARHAKSA